MSAPPGDNIWFWLIGVILVSGTGKVIIDGVRDFFRSRKSSGEQHVATIDASIVTVARARDELEQDNKRLREQIIEERARHAEDRSRWEGEKASFRREIAELQAQIRQERAEAERRYDALSNRLTEIIQRHAPAEGNDR